MLPPRLAMLSKKERSQLGELVEANKLPSINMVIEFAYKSARLSDVSLPALTKIGEALSDGQLADATFVIAGHTDSIGGQQIIIWVCLHNVPRRFASS